LNKINIQKESNQIREQKLLSEHTTLSKTLNDKKSIDKVNSNHQEEAKLDQDANSSFK
jgi:hypothetical protein